MGEMLAMMSGIKLLHVPYKGGTASVVGMVAGEVNMAISSPLDIVPQAQAGKMRVLAVTGKKRWAKLPDTPTAEEAGVKGFDVSTWNGLAAGSALLTTMAALKLTETRDRRDLAVLFFLAAFLALLQLSSNVAQGPFQGFIPDLVPERQVGRASALVGMMRIIVRLSLCWQPSGRGSYTSRASRCTGDGRWSAPGRTATRRTH